MKQVVLLLAALAATPAFAQKAYVSGAVGMAEQVVAYEGDEITESKAGATVAAGYRFSANLGIEGGYASFGKVWYKDGADRASLKSDAYYGAVVGSYPLAANVSLTGKLGLARGSSVLAVETDALRGRAKANRTSAMLGIGAVFAVTPALAVVTEYQHFGKTADVDGVSVRAALASIGARYTF